MKIPIKNIALSIFIFSGSAFNVLNAQSFIGSLNDSIIKYKAGEPQKSLDFGFLALESFKDEEEITLEYVNTNYYLGEVYYFLREYKTSFEYLSKSLELYDLLKPSIKNINKIIIENQENELYSVIDLYSIFVNNRGQLINKLTNDGLHLNEKGYKLWSKFIKPITDSL